VTVDVIVHPHVVAVHHHLAVAAVITPLVGMIGTSGIMTGMIVTMNVATVIMSVAIVTTIAVTVIVNALATVPAAPKRESAISKMTGNVVTMNVNAAMMSARMVQMARTEKV
jgi:hypothetical protein